ncbi:MULTISPECIES: hypothetical protein [unclassified Streptococcus]|uniref:hypothetical protein n=1 Tax=unclassified Streptococcus TaxID=2608887 RepID=UPI00359E26B5
MMALFLTVITTLCFSVILHEFLHWLVAVSLGYRPILKWIFFAPAICYPNQQNHWHNLCIAGLAPLSLVVLGQFIPAYNLFSFLLKLFFLANLFNLLPFTNDGEVILLSLYHIWRRTNEKKLD